MGIHTVFLDVAMAIGSPSLGWVADHRGLNAVFVGITVRTAAVAVKLLRRP